MVLQTNERRTQLETRDFCAAGEEDQDAYDINRLKKPVDDPPTLLHNKPPVERDMPPPLPEKERPRKRCESRAAPRVASLFLAGLLCCTIE